MQSIEQYLVSDSSLYGVSFPNWLSIGVAIIMICMIGFAAQLESLTNQRN